MSRHIMAIAFAVAAFGLDAAQQNLFPYAELKDGKISDLTRYSKFRKEEKIAGVEAPMLGRFV